MARVAVIMGGRSGEHEISLLSGSEVLKALDRQAHEAFPVVLSRENSWHVRTVPLPSGEGFDPGSAPDPPMTAGQALEAFLGLGIEVAFLALHGPYGEDGRIQGFLEVAGIPYTGSGVTASALCMDKVQCKRLMEQAGIPTPAWALRSLEEILGAPGGTLELAREFGLPLVLKTPCLGSSVGLHIPRDPEALARALADLSETEEDRVLVERYTPGRELTCAVLEGSGGPEALPPTEIIPISSPYFDYLAKYTPGASQEITPARLSEGETRRVQALALALHALMGCRGMSRSDFIESDGTYLALEINTIPGMTAQSLLPQAARCAGLTFGEVVDRLIRTALAGRAAGKREAAASRSGDGPGSRSAHEL